MQHVVRCTAEVDGQQAHIATDAVFDVNHQITRRQTADFGQEVLRTPTLARTDDTLAQYVLLREQREAAAFKAALQRQDGVEDTPRLIGVVVQRFGPTAQSLDAFQSSLAQIGSQPVGGPRR